MPRKNVTEISMYVGKDEREKLKDHASARGFKSVSDYLRSLVNADMKANDESELKEVVWGKGSDDK